MSNSNSFTLKFSLFAISSFVNLIVPLFEPSSTFKY